MADGDGVTVRFLVGMMVAMSSSMGFATVLDVMAAANVQINRGTFQFLPSLCHNFWPLHYLCYTPHTILYSYSLGMLPRVTLDYVTFLLAHCSDAQNHFVLPQTEPGFKRPLVIESDVF